MIRVASGGNLSSFQMVVQIVYLSELTTRRESIILFDLFRRRWSVVVFVVQCDRLDFQI